MSPTRGSAAFSSADGDRLRAVREIYASQGPLSLFATYPLYVLFGADIVAARLAVATYSIAGVLVAYWIGRRLDDRSPGSRHCLSR